MAYVKLGDFVYNCALCHTRCDGISKGVYQFDNDAAFSEKYEQLIIQRINRSAAYLATKSIEKGYPDIEIKTIDEKVYKYLEVKVQQRTFMSVEKYLPDSNLMPSETIALNLSDLLRYFEIERLTGKAISIVWVLLNRPCILKQREEEMYFQHVQSLKNIYETEQLKRRFRRKSGEGDVVDGMHKGVTVNYHFSLKELIHWNI
jgi:hypothetical protein